MNWGPNENPWLVRHYLIVKSWRCSTCRNIIAPFGITTVAMVNHGRSGGCVTCKARRVKCDEGRLECQSCQRLSLRCGGYKTKPVRIRFKDQNPKFCTEIGPKKAAQDKHWLPNLRSLAEPDPAVPFFLRHYAIMGRDMGSTRGFF
jgi:hypothetical protein